MANPTALTVLYTSADEINDILSENAVELRLDDDDSESIDVDEQLRLTHILSKATAKCNLYLLERYAATQLADSWQVHHWASVIGARLLCLRRANPVPESLEAEYDEAIEEMSMVKANELSLGDIPQRENDQMAFSNTTVDQRYQTRRVRVQRPISDRSPTSIPQNRHWPSEFTVEP